jgi:hypothetical protein
VIEIKVYPGVLRSVRESQPEKFKNIQVFQLARYYQCKAFPAERFVLQGEILGELWLVKTTCGANAAAGKLISRHTGRAKERTSVAPLFLLTAGPPLEGPKDPGISEVE